MSIKLKDIAILNIKVSDYACVLSLISKMEAINVTQSADLNEKSGTLKKNVENYKLIEEKIFENMYKNGKGQL